MDKFIVHRDDVDQSPRKQVQDGAVAWLPGREMRAFAVVLRAVGELNETPQMASTERALEALQADDSVGAHAGRGGIGAKCLPNKRRKGTVLR